MTYEMISNKSRFSLKKLCFFGLLVLDSGRSLVSAQQAQVGTRQPGTRQPGQAAPVQQPVAPLPQQPIAPPPPQPVAPQPPQPNPPTEGNTGTRQPGQNQGGTGTNQPGGQTQGSSGTNQPGSSQAGQGTVTTLPGTYRGPGADNKAVCPDTDQQTYYTPTGVFFWMQCSRNHPTSVIQKTPATSFQACLDKCGEEPTCKSVNFHNTGDRSCTLFGGTGASTTEAERTTEYHYAFTIDPPTQDVKDEELVACSTTCPTGNGQSYSSPFGETFRLNCGKRHGTTYLKSDKQNSLQDCMDSCASFLPCNSVDYHEGSGTCYYSKHHGEPTFVTPGFSSAYSLGCTGACSGNNGSCCGCSTSIPSKPAGPETPDLSCGNQGLQYAIYPNKRADGTGMAYNDEAYSALDIQVFKTADLEYTGKTTAIGVSDSTVIYGNRPSDPGLVTVNHRGYVFAQQAGEYTFSFTRTDNIAFLWVGPDAFSGYTRANANIMQKWVGTGGGLSQPYKVTFAAGKYYPIRVLFANGGGPGYFSLRLTAPDGTVIISDSTTEESPFLVQYSCDKTSAPRFPPFGNEK